MNNELQKLLATAERLRSDPEAARKLFVQAGIYTEEWNLSEAFGGTMNKGKEMNNQFDLEAAKRGEPILWNGSPAKFVAHVPEAAEMYRVVALLENGQIGTVAENGKWMLNDVVPIVTMAPRTVLTIWYRRYVISAAGLARVTVLQKDSDWRPEEVAKQDNFIAWIDHEWQYDEVEI
jgi:hypothetical protein